MAWHVGRAAAWARPVEACRARGGGRPSAACRARGRRRRARRVGRAAIAGGGVPGGWQREVKGKGEERTELVGRFTYLLCRVPAIRHSAKIFLKFKNKLCRVPDRGHSTKTSLPSASYTGTRQRSVLQSLPSGNGQALGKAVFAEC
jgi:hypothetical protein